LKNKRIVIPFITIVVIIIAFSVRQLVMEFLSPFESVPTINIDFAKTPRLDPSIWSYEVGNKVAGYNNEQQTYTKNNVFFADEGMTIKALIQELNQRHYTSTRINMFGFHDVIGGKFVVVAKFPRGIGTFPAIWLRTSESRSDGKMTAEIDIAEAQGARPGLIFVNVHTAETIAAGDNKNQGMISVPDMYETFHAYGVEWTSDKIVFTLDGVPFHEVKIEVRYKLHLVVNLALGGNWAQSLSDRLQLGFPNGIDEKSRGTWNLAVKSVQYFPLKTPIVR
jgi:beta-glucanase (GH16 family)